MRLKIYILLFVLLFPGAAWGAACGGTCWVHPTDGVTANWASGACKSLSDPGEGNYCTLASANANADDGDIIYLKAGAYPCSGTLGVIEPANSGTSGSVITFARVPAEDKPTITCSSESISPVGLANKSYIKIDGIVATGNINAYGISLYNNSHYNEITNCEVYGTPHTGIIIGASAASNHNWIHNNILTGRAGGLCTEGGDAIRIGDAWQEYYSTNNTVEDNTFYNSGHAHFDAYSHRYTVFRNNIMRNEPWWTGQDGCTQGWTPDYTIGDWHNKWAHRNFQIGFNQDSSNTLSLVEGNRAGYAGVNPANDGNENYDIAARGTIFRYNSSYGSTGRGINFKYVNSAANGLGGTNCRVYNNTSYSEGKTYTGGSDVAGNPGHLRTGILLINGTTDHSLNVVKNNIVYDNTDGDLIGCQADYPYACNNANFASLVTASNNFCTSSGTGCTQTGDPKFVTPTITNYTSTTLPNLNLQSDSTAINGGTYLTQANGSGENSATLIVDDALYFQDGTWGSSLSTISADWIAIGTVSNVHQISSINYATNTITLATTTTWADNANIWLYKKSDGTQVLYGSAPDFGAYEYLGYTFSLTVAGTGTCSVTSSPSGINTTTSTTHDFTQDTEITLTATPAGGSEFAGWSGTGGCSGTGTCVLTVDGTNDAATATCNLTGTMVNSHTKGAIVRGGNVR